MYTYVTFTRYNNFMRQTVLLVYSFRMYIFITVHHYVVYMRFEDKNFNENIDKLIYGRMFLTGDPMMSSMKPAPLQFVKLSPSDLYRSAQDQLNKTAAVVAKPKPKEFDADWQSVSD